MSTIMWMNRHQRRKNLMGRVYLPSDEEYDPKDSWKETPAFVTH